MNSALLQNMKCRNKMKTSRTWIHFCMTHDPHSFGGKHIKYSKSWNFSKNVRSTFEYVSGIECEKILDLKKMRLENVTIFPSESQHPIRRKSSFWTERLFLRASAIKAAPTSPRLFPGKWQKKLIMTWTFGNFLAIFSIRRKLKNTHNFPRQKRTMSSKIYMK